MKDIKEIIVIAFLVLSIVFGAHAQTGHSLRHFKHAKHKKYSCKKVGVQKVKAYHFSKKETVYFNEHDKHMPISSIKRIIEEKHRIHDSIVSAELALLESEVETIDTIVEEVIKPLPKPVYFRFDKDVLAYQDTAQIKLAVDYAKEGSNVELQGHTDSEGTSAYNKRLSMKRAKRIKAMMLAMDESLNPSKIKVVGYGETKPAIANDSNEHKLLNRRVEFVISE